MHYLYNLGIENMFEKTYQKPKIEMKFKMKTKVIILIKKIS